MGGWVGGWLGWWVGGWVAGLVGWLVGGWVAEWHGVQRMQREAGVAHIDISNSEWAASRQIGVTVGLDGNSRLCVPCGSRPPVSPAL
jgi:hypothetical protein